MTNFYINFSQKELDRIQQQKMYVYRIFPFKWFVNLLESNNNVLVQPQKKWDDPYENPFKNVIIDIDSGREFLMNLFKKIYAQCWSLHNESDAMWRIYSSDKKGVLVKVRVDNLLQSLSTAQQIHTPQLQKLFIGKVIYKTEQNLKKTLEDPSYIQEIRSQGNKLPIAAMKSLLYKRDSFKHEKEVRIILVNKVSDDSQPEIFPFTIDPNKLIESVTLDPRLNEKEYKRQKNKIIKSGYSGEISKSSLYNLPTLNLRGRLFP